MDSPGSSGIVELTTDTVTRVDYDAQAPPLWLPDGSAILLTGRRLRPAPTAPAFDGARGAARPDRATSTVGVLRRPGNAVAGDRLRRLARRVAAVAADGRIAYLRADGSLRITDDAAEPGRVPAALGGERIGAAAFAPGEDAMVVVVLGSRSGGGEDRARRAGRKRAGRAGQRRLAPALAPLTDPAGRSVLESARLRWRGT